MVSSDRQDDLKQTVRGWGNASTDRDFGPDPLIGNVVGVFQLKELLGVGSMGRVYLAEQLEPVKRLVAVKLMQKSLLDSSHAARFAVEQQSLARMSHPAIAQVFQSGTTEDGRPYFAMEHVLGADIAEFCRKRKLGLTQRLELFARVCRGVQHAHQKGVIHRDLKPSNILVHEVDEPPLPKIIDFGIATAAPDDCDPVTAQKRGVAGTPCYMSPEQADASETDIDTRSDIYSLGAVLYELLTGTTPVAGERLRETSREQLSKVLQKAEIEPPSQRLQHRPDYAATLMPSPSERQRLLPRIRSEIDWIVVKALAANRMERYESAAALAQDVEAFLAGDVVQAVPQTFGYRMKTFGRRHRALLIGGIGITLALLVGLSLATWGFLQARHQRDRAREAEAHAVVEAAKTAQIAAFTQEMLSGVDPAAAGALDKTLVRKILGDASERISSDLGGQPEVAAAIHHTVGVTYSALGEYDRALEHLIAARELWQQEVGIGENETLLTLVELALVYRRQGRYDEAEEVLRATVNGLREVHGDDHQETLTAITNLASLQLWQGRLDEAEALYSEALEGCRRTLGPDHRSTLTATNNLALLYFEQGRLEEAEPLYIDVLEKSRRILGQDHPDTINSLNNLAALMDELERYDEGETLYKEAIEGGRQVLGPDHPETLNMINNLAVLYRHQGRLNEATELHLEVLEVSRRVLGPDHPDTLNTLTSVGIDEKKRGNAAAAAIYLAEAAEAAQRTLPEDSVLAGNIYSNYGAVLTVLGRFAEAETTLLAGRDILYRTLGPDHRLSQLVTTRLEELAKRRG